MAEELSKAGLFIDELNKLRIVDPVVTQDTNELKEECGKYLQSTSCLLHPRCNSSRYYQNHFCLLASLFLS